MQLCIKGRKAAKKINLLICFYDASGCGRFWSSPFTELNAYANDGSIKLGALNIFFCVKKLFIAQSRVGLKILMA